MKLSVITAVVVTATSLTQAAPIPGTSGQSMTQVPKRANIGMSAARSSVSNVDELVMRSNDSNSDGNHGHEVELVARVAVSSKVIQLGEDLVDATTAASHVELPYPKLMLGKVQSAHETTRRAANHDNLGIFRPLPLTSKERASAKFEAAHRAERSVWHRSRTYIRKTGGDLRAAPTLPELRAMRLRGQAGWDPKMSGSDALLEQFIREHEAKQRGDDLTLRLGLPAFASTGARPAQVAPAQRPLQYIKSLQLELRPPGQA